MNSKRTTFKSACRFSLKLAVEDRVYSKEQRVSKSVPSKNTHQENVACLAQLGHWHRSLELLWPCFPPFFNQSVSICSSMELWINHLDLFLSAICQKMMFPYRNPIQEYIKPFSILALIKVNVLPLYPSPFQVAKLNGFISQIPLHTFHQLLCCFWPARRRSSQGWTHVRYFCKAGRTFTRMKKQHLSCQRLGSMISIFICTTLQDFRKGLQNWSVHVFCWTKLSISWFCSDASP